MSSFQRDAVAAPVPQEIKDRLTAEIACQELIRMWIDALEYRAESITEEIQQVKGAISNEELWLIGSAKDEDSVMHKGNLDALYEYLDCLEQMSRQLRENGE